MKKVLLVCSICFAALSVTAQSKKDSTIAVKDTSKVQGDIYYLPGDEKFFNALVTLLSSSEAPASRVTEVIDYITLAVDYQKKAIQKAKAAGKK